jgi:hypothetical protein
MVLRAVGFSPGEAKDFVPILMKECRVPCLMDDELQSVFEV